MNSLEQSEFIPLDAVHQYAYCPRRAYLMYHDGQWESNYYTDDGLWVHARVDGSNDSLPEPKGDEDPPLVARSVSLVSEVLGISAKLDLVEAEGLTATPVETKRGKTPENEEKSWLAERVQLMAQGLLLREAGFTTSAGILYFYGSRQRVPVPFTEALETFTLETVKRTHVVLQSSTAPPPLVDSPKCQNCSLSAICMPDESSLLSIGREEVSESSAAIRRLFPARDDALPLYVQEQGAWIGKTGEGLIIKKAGKILSRVRLIDISQLVICGSVQVSTQALHLLTEHEIPVVYLSTGGWFYGVTAGQGLRNAYTKQSQFRCADDPQKTLSLAKAFVFAKCTNQRTIITRNGSKDSVRSRKMKEIINSISSIDTIDQLLGAEGLVGALYFRSFGTMIKVTDCISEFSWKSRNRRPPKDPINAMLSFGYALLSKECTVALIAAGLDPHWGYFHKPRHGRPALSLDLMEEFRPLIVDSAVITAINNGMVRTADFITGAGGCALTSSGRKQFIRAYEARMDQLVTHPVFDYRLSWRRVVRVQTQLLAKTIRGDLNAYKGIITR